MAQATFNKCCFCVDLRTGNFIIAYIQLVFGIACFIYISYSFSVAQDDVNDSLNELLKSNSRRLSDTMNGVEIDDKTRITEAQDTVSELMSEMSKILDLIIIYYLLMVTMTFLGFNFSLLFGLHQSKPIYIKVFMIYMTVVLAFNILGWLVCFASTHTTIKYIIGFPISTLVFAFFLLNIRSYYYTMVDSNVENRSAINYGTK